MYFDFEDYRPETPSLNAPMTRREAVLLALLFHAVLVIIYLITPPEWFVPVHAVPNTPVPDKQLTYMRVEPLREIPRTPKPEAPASDLDRKASAPEKAPKPTEPDPYSKGNTADKVQGQQAEKMKGPETPTPAPSTTPPPPQPVKPAMDDGLLNQAKKPAGGSLGQSLKNLQQIVRDQNLDNRQGGQNTDTDAAIQFDSKGVDFSSWLRRFEARVKRNWYIPAAADSLSGHVSITFYVHRNGGLTELQIVRVSGVSSFDSAALQALKLSNPVDPLPAAYPDDQVLFTVTFFYNERIR